MNPTFLKKINIEKMKADGHSYDLVELEKILGGGLTFEDVQPWVSFTEAKYARNLIYKNENFEILCICWKPGQRSSIHDHTGSNCGAVVMQGTCRESFYECKDPSKKCASPKRASVTCEVGAIMCSGPGDIHRIENPTEQNLVSIHIYSPPLVNYVEFEESAD